MYENLDELLMEKNPKGGRPAHIGSLIFNDRTCIDLQQIKEECERRYHLGYCQCGRRIVVGENRAQALVETLGKRGFRPEPRRSPWRIRLAKRLLKSYPQQGLT
jgi:hypothetical protein